MNAYELADELQELDAKLHLIVLFKSAEMLRQQADRIAELKWEINHLEQSVDSLRTTLFDIKQKYDTKNKHYVYTQVYVDELQANIDQQACRIAELEKQTKPLSDEEIMDIAEQSDYSPVEIEMGYDYEIRIARAIEERHGIK